MASVGIRLLLFLSSYFPLSLIFFVLYLSRNRWIAVGILLLGNLGLAGMAVYLRAVQQLGLVTIKVDEIERKDAEAMAYIVTYIIPFLSIPFTGWQEGFALGIFFVVLGILYVNSNMIHINPMLNLAGFHLYEIRLENGGSHALITRRRIIRGEGLSVVKLGDDIFLEKTHD